MILSYQGSISKHFNEAMIYQVANAFETAHKEGK